ncbi:hypothetical protein SAMN05444673_2815 [Bacillus sp. OV166]|uniref:hypothetical protein n=1 Tax=Bacillus sp. OV166 TaxID=1882763 RepID=UPI000A2AB0EA|nr:hypothetical protein [Bacillus sp. OV166]SMQ77487.1 hypothetical protein SAMN05444673_2815 [Bacillus sp. OV166]
MKVRQHTLIERGTNEIETENHFLKFSSMRPYQNQDSRGLYIWGLYGEKEDEDYIYFFFLKVTEEFEVRNKECLKRRSDEWLDSRGKRVDHTTIFVPMNEEVLLAIQDWYFKNLERIKQLFFVRTYSNQFIH